MVSLTTPMPLDGNAPAAKPAGAVRMFGRYQLMRLLGKSDHTMAWLVMNTQDQQEYMLTMPRKAPQAEALQAWQLSVKRAGRLNHPCLARVADIGEHERWPYVAYDRGTFVTWAERFSRQGVPGADVALWAAQAAQGLAFVHEAGLAHHDLQPWMLLVDEDQKVAVMGLEVAGRRLLASRDGAMDELRAVRDAAEIDVLALGLVMHHGLVGQPALDEADVSKVVARMPPQGQDIVRLPWTVPRPIPEPLRAIVNRASDHQQRQRYRNARTLQRALEGWLKTCEAQSGGPLALLLDRLRSVGVLPAQLGGADRAARLALMERCRTSELAEVVLGDLALTFELLRMVNTAQVHGDQVASTDGPVLMLRRAIAMLGVDGVRRAALSLRPWPGPMNEAAAVEMETLIRRVQRAARIAVRLAPAGYDGEVISLVTMLQNLGRLVVQYHFPEESAQIRRLMMPAESLQAGTADDPGMSAEAASFAVLGVDVEVLGLAVAQHWGLDDSVQHLIRRIPPDSPVRQPEGDNDILRATASCANDLVDALTQPARRVPAALKNVAQRYARPLAISPREMQEALQIELQSASSQTVQQAAGVMPPGHAAGATGRTGNSARAS
ncbi:HDOD domain-containing protein [Ideonella margarita]|uniref:HDOD domain-containing protein n=1 Tax=Ideonella margarita TaxID=2984191 RepID=A0ABU9C1X9_9BURK